MDNDDKRTVGFEANETRPDSIRQRPFDEKDTALDHHEVQARVEAAVLAVESSQKDPLLGKTISGRFEVVSRIGAGGMGVVYKARQAGMDRYVAIKVLLRELAHDEKVVKRFKIEALAVSRLTHPNTIRIYDFGQTEDGTLFFAMEYLEGRSLEETLRQDGPLSVARTIHILRQITDSLAEAHAKGIVHRDLKPDNIFLTQVGSDPDFVKVLDFGVAKLREADKRQGTVTQAGTIFGTPRYMAPEQCRSMAVDHRADIYALGVIAYEMLTGKPPFDAENPLGILIKHVQEPPPKMATIRPDIHVPEELERLVMRCLEKAQDRRYQSVEELGKELARIEAGLAGRFNQVVFVTVPREVQLPTRVEKAVPVKKKSLRKWLLLFTPLVIGLIAVIFVFAPKVEETMVPSESPAVAVTTHVSPKVEEPVIKKVRVQFDSVPQGVEVLDGGNKIGETPFFMEFEAGKGPKEFVFRKNGYKDTTKRVSLENDETLNVTMAKLPVSAPKSVTPSVTSAPPQKKEEVPSKKEEGPSKVGDLKKVPY